MQLNTCEFMNLQHLSENTHCIYHDVALLPLRKQKEVAPSLSCPHAAPPPPTLLLLPHMHAPSVSVHVAPDLGFMPVSVVWV